MKLTESTFLLYAAKHYDNPHCADVVEFEDDLKRFQYIRKLLVRYKADGDLKERLILNHLIVIYNVFGPEATNMIFMKIKDLHDCLKPFVVYLNFMQDLVEYENAAIPKGNIGSDNYVEAKLKGI